MEPARCSGSQRGLALLTVILSAAALALYWVFLVPIYQAPDEPMNLDYALAINEHGGLFWVHNTSYQELPTSVHPHTFYLAARCRSGAVAFQPQTKMPPEYGSWDYFVTLDREAPARECVTITTPNKPFAVYPYGYYALLASWIGCLHLIHDGPVFVFFGARILSVLLLIITLFTIDATARRLGFKPWKALLLTACVGFFPLTTFVAAAVQSDNLSFTLVSVSFYLAVRLRDTPCDARLQTLLGLALAALLVTKIHFFVCVAVPVLLMLVVELRHARICLRHWFWVALRVSVPCTLTGGLYLWTTWGTTNFYYPPAGKNDLFLQGLYHFKAAFDNYYAGATHDSFWGRFGWMDTPLIIRGKRTTEVIQFLIQGTAWLFLALTLLRLEQITSRMVRLLKNGRGNWACRMIVSNPLINSYFLFTILMFYIYIRVGNRFGAQGRNWLPMLLPIFLVGIRYAPKALTFRRSSVTLGRVAFAGLLLYGMIGSYYSIPTLKKRFYVPNHPVLLTQTDRQTLETLDE
jgi:4-amino-4-deoxy-L-arabinose transferase-like glycosyltransferase